MTSNEIIQYQAMAEQLKKILDEIEHECHSLKETCDECAACHDSIDAKIECSKLNNTIFKNEQIIIGLREIIDSLQQELEDNVPLAPPPYH